MAKSLKPTRRFTRRATDYRRARPSYPKGVYDLLFGELGLRSGEDVADLGSGTGIFTRPLLERGARVYAVEPNGSMRQAAEEEIGALPGFRSVDGTAEQTTLEDRSVDLVVSAQAFHWFDFESTRVEVARILRPGRSAALVWNTRRVEGPPFLKGYERLLERWGDDYHSVRETYGVRDRLTAFFDAGTVAYRTFSNVQQFDLAGLEARIASSSYMPQAGDPRYDAMIEDLGRLFADHSEDGLVSLDYDTEVFSGTVS